jgi:hypothetical protein
MATVNKDFKVKNGLIVEGTTATVNNHDILTKKTDDQNYIIGLIGGTATSTNTANAVVKRDASGNFAAGTITATLTGNVTGNVTGNASTATTLETARTIAGQSFDGSANISIAPTDLTGVTATAAELNILDGVTASASELNILDGVTASTAELNYVDGVTSAIQTQIDAKAPTASPTFTGTVSGITSTMVGLGNVDNTSDANKPVSTATQTELDLKAPLASPALTGTPTAPTAAAGTSSTQVATTAFVGTAVANLVGTAAEALNTLGELSDALADDPNFATTIATSIGTKAPTDSPTFTGTVTLPNGTVSTAMVADSAITSAKIADGTIVDADINATAAIAQSKISGLTSDLADKAPLASPALTGVPTAPTAAANTNTTQVATTAFAKAEADAAEAAAIAYADALTTADVAEGSNLYYTAARAKAEAATLLANATKTNIVITKDGSDNLTITAENGVADSNTDALVEGTTNLYFTNARAVTALEAVTPDFPAVEIASVAKQVAAQATVATASTSTAVLWAKADYRSAEFLVKIAAGTHTEVSKVILTLDTSDNVAITEYAMVGTNGDLGSVSADVSGNDVRLRVATLNNDSTVAVVGTLLK